MKRKWMFIIIILTLLTNSFIPLVKSSFTHYSKPSSSKKNTLDMFLPEYYFNLSKAPSMFKRYGKTYIEEFNFPIGTFGNKRRVILLREEDDKITKYRLDLTDERILTSALFVVKSNDIIYVEPLRAQKWGFETFPYTLILTIVTSAFVVNTYILNLY